MAHGVQLIPTKWWNDNKRAFEFIDEVGQAFGDLKEDHLSKREWQSVDFDFRDCLGIYVCRMEQTYYSIAILLHEGNTDDCFALLRKFYEGLISFGYLCTDRRLLAKQCIEYELVYSIRLLQFRSSIHDGIDTVLEIQLNRVMEQYGTKIFQFMQPQQAIPSNGIGLIQVKYYDNWTKLDLATVAQRADMSLCYDTTIKFCNGYVHPRSTLPYSFLRRDEVGNPTAFDPNPNPDSDDIQHLASDLTLGLLRLIELIYASIGIEIPQEHGVLVDKWKTIFIGAE